jgi:hypothetical protein
VGHRRETSSAPHFSAVMGANDLPATVSTVFNLKPFETVLGIKTSPTTWLKQGANEIQSLQTDRELHYFRLPLHPTQSNIAPSEIIFGVLRAHVLKRLSLHRLLARRRQR